jgi:hypothetical protein
MSVNIYIVLIGCLITVGFVLLVWKVAFPLLKEILFKRTTFYKNLMMIREEYNQSMVLPNQDCKLIKGKKIYITEPIDAEEFKKNVSEYDQDSDLSQDFFVDIIAKHIKDYPNDFKDYLDCIEKNLHLFQKTNEKIIEQFKQYGMPNEFQKKVLAKNKIESEEMFCIVVELVIQTAEKTLNERFELPYEYIKTAFEKYSNAV